MTNKEKAQELWAIVMDRTLSNAQHREALDNLVALKKTAKTSLDKLGVPQVMWDRENQTNLHNASLEEDIMAAKLEAEALEAEALEAEALEAEALEAIPDPLEEPLNCAVAETPAKAEAVLKTGAGVGTKAPDRGGISALVRKLLLETDETYQHIADQVREEFPEAKTSSRSVASTAADMRKAGLKVGMRRAAKGEGK